jgi:hypothetical protein
MYLTVLAKAGYYVVKSVETAVGQDHVQEKELKYPTYVTATKNHEGTNIPSSFNFHLSHQYTLMTPLSQLSKPMLQITFERLSKCI